jgi:hypothetical protein
MACTVLIDTVVVTPLIGDQHTIQEITVTGRAEPNSNVTVTVKGGATISHEIHVGANGLWSDTFDVKNALWECGESGAIIIASSTGHPECETDTKLVFGHCPHPSGPCPVIMGVTASVSDTCEADKRTVTFDADVRIGNDPAPASSVNSYRWEFGDPANTVVQRSGTQGPGPVSHSYAVPTDRVFLVTLTLGGTGQDPSGFNCLDASAISVSVPACGCPSVIGSGLTVAPGDCSADGSQQVMTLQAQFSGRVDEFQWDFGDGQNATSPAGSTGANLRSHPYATPGTYHARVIARTEGCPDVTGEATVALVRCGQAPGGGHPGDDQHGEGDDAGGETARPWYCPWLEAIMMIMLILTIITGLALACEIIGGIHALPTTGPLALPIFGFLLVGTQLLVSQFLTFAILCFLAGLLWIIFCRPDFCRVLEDITWCFSWAAFIAGVLGAILAIVCWEVWLYVLVIGLVLLALTSLLVKRGCQILDPFSFPWMRD